MALRAEQVAPRMLFLAVGNSILKRNQTCANLPNVTPRQKGFALMTVLVFAAIISGAIYFQASHVGQFVGYIKAYEIDQKRKFDFESSLNGAIFTLLDIGSDERKLFLQTRKLTWPSNGTTYEIYLEYESGKIDLNAADASFIERSLQWSVPNELRDGILQSFRYRVENQQGYISADELLPNHLRHSNLSQAIRSTFTVYSGQFGIIPQFANEIVLRSLPGGNEYQLSNILAARSAFRPVHDNLYSWIESDYLGKEKSIFRLIVYFADDDTAPGMDIIIDIDPHTLHWKRLAGGMVPSRSGKMPIKYTKGR